MKTIVIILLIILMGSSRQKENTMPIDEGNRDAIRSNAALRAKQTQQKPAIPAWLGKIVRTTNQNGNSGGGNPPTPPNQPSWWNNPQANQQPWQNMGAANPQANQQPWQNMGAANPLATQQQPYRPSNPSPVSVPTPRSANRGALQAPKPATRIPNWMYNNPNITAGWMAGAPNINPNMPTTPTGSFLAGDGSIVMGENGAVQTGTPSIPTGSFLAADGEAVRGPNSQAYYPWSPMGVNTFIAAGGTAVRGPDGAIVNPGSGADGSGGGFGTRYRGWGGGGGGGGWSDYGSSPAWIDPAYMNLYSWNYRG